MDQRLPTDIRHEWVRIIMGWHTAIYDGKVSPRGARKYARVHYRCRRCGVSLPEGRTPMPWWTDEQAGKNVCQTGISETL